MFSVIFKPQIGKKALIKAPKGSIIPFSKVLIGAFLRSRPFALKALKPFKRLASKNQDGSKQSFLNIMHKNFLSPVAGKKRKKGV